MLDVYLAANVGIAAVLILIDLFVISKNSQAQINRYFFVAVLFLAAWIIANYFSNAQTIGHTAALLANHLVLFFSALLVYYLAKFVALLSHIRLFEKYSVPLAAVNYLAAFLTLTPFVIQSISKQGTVYAVQFGSLAPVYFTILGLNAIAIAYSLHHGLRKSTGIDRLRIQTVFWSLLVTLLIILVTNAVVPIITGSFTLTNIGPLFSIIFVWGVAYSIVRHKLFDIRAVVARSVAYLLLLSTLAVLFVAGVFAVTSLFFQSDRLSAAVRITFASLAIILAFALQPLKRFFDKVTNRIFYRDAYDPQVLLNELNRSLVTTIDLSDLLNKSAKIISATIKAEYCSFAIKDISKEGLRFIGTRQDFEKLDSRKLTSIMLHHRDRLATADAISSEFSELKSLLSASDINVVVKLQGTVKGRIEHPGFILLGQKRSGNLYSAEDLRLLGIIADELVIAIQNSLRYEEIQQFNITLQQKVDDATKQLRHANQRLKALDQTKDEFISMASHQLRTPLTTIKGYLSMIIEGDVGAVKKEQEPLLKQAFDSAQNMVDLIADLLNVSRLQSGKFVIENKPTQLASMIEAEVKRLGEQATARNITLVFQKPSDTPVLNLDETKIRQVVMNFLDNAIYYTPKGGSITVELLTTPDSVTYTVTDTGVGVPKAVQHHLFSKFYRADNAKKMRPDGTGLGLFMAKKVIVAQGGAIIFKSTEGKGSTFGFSFPRKTAEVKA